MQLARMCVLEGLRLVPAVSAVVRKATTDIEVDGYNIPKGTMMFLSVVPNKHIDPLRNPLPASERRCPFDYNGVDRTATGHDGFDFNPYRWAGNDVHSGKALNTNGSAPVDPLPV